MLAGIAGLDDPYGSLPTWDILWFYDAGATAQGLAPQYNHPDGYRQGNAALGHKVPSFPAMKGYIYISRYPRPASQQSQQCASKYSCCSSQAGHKGKELLMQTCPFVSSPIKGFFLPQVSRGQENSKSQEKPLPGYKNFWTHYRNAAISHFYFDMHRQAYRQEAEWLFYTLYSHHFISASLLQLQHTCTQLF